MTAPQADTVVLDGLIEGPVPPNVDGAEKLNAWIEQANETHRLFNFDVEGASVSVLAVSDPAPASHFGERTMYRVPSSGVNWKTSPSSTITVVQSGVVSSGAVGSKFEVLKSTGKAALLQPRSRRAPISTGA